MTSATFGAISELAPAIFPDFAVDFSDGNGTANLIGPDKGITGERTYCDQDRMYIAADGQPRIGFDHDRMRWGLRRDVGSENLVSRSQFEIDQWSFTTVATERCAHNVAGFLLPSERCSMMDYRGEANSYVRATIAASINYVAGSWYTASVFFKNLDPTGVDVRLRHAAEPFGGYQDATYLAASDSVAMSSGSSADSIVGLEKYPDGWRRLTITSLCTVGGNFRGPLLWPGGARPGRFLFGGFQLEKLGFSTSYIPKSTATAVRGNERGVFAMLPAGVLVGANSGTIWTDHCIQTRLQGSAVGIAGFDRVPATAPYISAAATFGVAMPLQQAARLYFSGRDSVPGNPAAPQNLPDERRDTFCASWDNDAKALELCHLYGHIRADPIGIVPTFPGMDPAMSADRMCLGSMHSATSFIATGWIYGVRLYRRKLTRDQIMEEVGL